MELIKDLGMLYPRETSKYKARFGIFKCNCGNEFRTQIQSVKKRVTKSCGCYHKESATILNTIHGLGNHILYNVWSNMIKRCINPKCKSYKDYGERGIKVCERWRDINNFIEDMYPTFKEGLTLDRIDVNGNYEKSNCRWTTRAIQARNTRILRKDNTTGYRGVFWHKTNNNWTAGIVLNKKLKHLGSFNTPIEAAKAYDYYVLSNNLEHTINGVEL